MIIDSTFWVAVSFFLFFGGLIYLKVPQKINEILNKLITDIKSMGHDKYAVIKDPAGAVCAIYQKSSK